MFLCFLGRASAEHSGQALKSLINLQQYYSFKTVSMDSCVVHPLVSMIKTLDQKANYALKVLQTRQDRAHFASPSGTLKVMTQQCILNNKDFFIKMARLQPDRNPFNKISNIMKKELVELEAKNQYDRGPLEPGESTNRDVMRQCQVLQLLVNKKITSFDFPTGLDLETEASAIELWKALVAGKPPDLHTIFMRSSNPGINLRNLNSFLFRSLKHFPKLQVLRLANFPCNNLELRKIAKQLSSLRILEVDLGPKVSRKGFKALAKLSSLEEFLFVDNIKEEHTHLLQDCFELLPHLRAVSSRTGPLMSREDMELGDLIAGTLLNIGGPLTLQLRRLELDISDIPFPEHLQLPELQVLVLIGAWDETQQLRAARFPKLIELCVHGCTQEGLMSILREVGRQLRTLRFFNFSRYDLDTVLAACPNLSQLDVLAEELFCTSPLRPDTLQRLRSLYLTMDGPTSIQPGLLVQLLRLAPKLRIVHAGTIALGADEVQELEQLAKQRTSLRKLEELALKLYFTLSMVNVPCHMDHAFYAMALHCPRLRSITINYDYNFLQM